MTLNLKNLVGINGDKNWLPHYCFGSPDTGGDQFPQTNRKNLAENFIVTFGKTDEVIRSGNWFGNDTTWRMCLDLNRILMYGNNKGILITENGEPVKSSFIAMGFDPLNVDLVCTKLMGYDYKKIKLLSNSFNKNKYPIYQNTYEQIKVVSNLKKINRSLQASFWMVGAH